MTFKQGTKLDHLLKIQKVLEVPEHCDYYGIFQWDEDIFKKENGIYKPAGRIVLPMTVESRNPITHEGAFSVAFTIFENDYFEGLSAPTPIGYKSGEFDFQALCDWRDDGPDGNISGTLVQTFIRSEDSYSIVRSHIANILGNLEKITEKAREANVEHLVKRTFIEY